MTVRIGQIPAIAGSARKIRVLVLVAASALSALIVAGCAVNGLSSAPATTTSLGTASQFPQAEPTIAIMDKRSPVKVALILPLSGRAHSSAVAQAMRSAGEMALFDFDNPSVQLIVKDTKGTPEGAQAAATQALAAGAELIIGPLFSSSVTAVKPIAKKANVPVIAFSSDPRVAGGGVYLLSFIAGYEVPRIVSYAAAQGRRNIAALIPEGPYGKIVEDKLRLAAARSGVTLSAIESYPQEANGMLAPVKRIKEAMEQSASEGAPVDSLLIAADQTSLPMLGSLMPFARIDTKQVKLIGTSGWDTSRAGREKALLGGWYPSPDPRGWRTFSRRYAKSNGDGLPPRIASLTYDAVSIAINLSSAGKKGQRYTAANLTRAKGFAGTDGLFRFSKNGLPERGLAILEVRNLGGTVIDAAPSSFGRRPASATASTGSPKKRSAFGSLFNLTQNR